MDFKLKQWLCRLLNCQTTTTNLTDSLLVLSVRNDQYCVKVNFIYKDKLYYFSSYDNNGWPSSRFLQDDSEVLKFTKGSELLKQNGKLHNLLIKWSHRIDLPRKNQTVLF